MSVKLKYLIKVTFFLSFVLSGKAFADMEGDQHFPVAGGEGISDEELIEHHDNVLYEMYDEYDKKLKETERFYNGDLMKLEKLHEQRMERRGIMADLRRERAAQRAEAHEEYLKKKAEFSKEEFEKKNYFVEAMQEKRDYYKRKEAEAMQVDWDDSHMNMKESNEMEMQMYHEDRQNSVDANEMKMIWDQ